MTGRRALVPYWQPPPTNPAADERQNLVMAFAHEIRNSPGETPESLARRLLTRLDLRGWGPGATQRWAPGAGPGPRTDARGPQSRRMCPIHQDQLPCRGCRADAKAADPGP